MNRRIKTIGWLTAVAMFLGLTLSCQQESVAKSPAPNFTLRNLSGETVTLEEYRGRVVLLDFWATWCPPCRRAIPELVKLQEKYGDKGLVILGVSMDDPQLANDEFLQMFKEKMKINYPILRADEWVVRAYFPDGRTAIPTLYLIDREGTIREKVVGYRPGALERVIVELLG